MTSFQLKIIAILTMVIDHVGAIFFPHIILFRVIGRISFLIFAFLVSEGVRHTRNIYRYLALLGLFAVISQPAFWFAFGSDNKNIFFTLLAGALSIVVYRNIKSKPAAFFLISLLVLISIFFSFDYSFYGVLLPLAFYLVDRKNIQTLFVIFGSLTISYIVFVIYFNHLDITKITIWSYLQLFSLLSLPIISNYNEKQGPKFKYFFYIFYPAHLLILGAIKIMI